MIHTQSSGLICLSENMQLLDGLGKGCAQSTLLWNCLVKIVLSLQYHLTDLSLAKALGIKP